MLEKINHCDSTAEILEAKAGPNKADEIPVQVRFCDSYLESVKAHPATGDSIKKFVAAKIQDPLASYGGSDTHFVGNGPFGGLKLKHAHISQDLSIVYRMHSKPIFLDLYGIFSHKELGTSNSPNVKTQKIMAKKFATQTFKENK